MSRGTNHREELSHAAEDATVSKTPHEATLVCAYKPTPMEQNRCGTKEIMSTRTESTHQTPTEVNSLTLATAKLCQNTDTTEVDYDRPPNSHEKGDGTDSGYGSLNITPEGTPLLRKRVIKLNIYRKDIPETVCARFSDLRELLGKPLLEYVSKSRNYRNDILMLLKMLGTDKASAKPWIVVQCDRVIAKKVAQFFKQPNIKEHCQSADFPTFQVHVEARPPKRLGTKSPRDVFIRGDFSRTVPTTLSGSYIKASNSAQVVITTLGGMITVSFMTGPKQIFGLTVAHILGDEVAPALAELDYEPEEDDRDEEEEEEDEEEEDGEEEEEIIELNCMEDEFDYMGDEIDDHMCHESVGEAEIWNDIGHISTYSTATPGGQNLDWALVKIKDKRFIQPNSCLEFDEESEFPGRPSPTPNGRRVRILSGSTGPKEGILYTQRAHLILGQGETFTETYSVSLNSGSRMAVGDSGSWVIDKQHSQVYGYVTCSDAFGDAIVIPMRSALVNIASRLGAVRARLLWKSDISAADEVNDGKSGNEGEELQSTIANHRDVMLPGRQQEGWLFAIRSLLLGATTDGGIAAKPCPDNALTTETVSPMTPIFTRSSEQDLCSAIQNATHLRNRSRDRNRVQRSRSRSLLPPQPQRTASSIASLVTSSHSPENTASTTSPWNIVSSGRSSGQSQPRSHQNSTSSSEDFYYGRNHDQWLFGNFSIHNTVRDVVPRRSSEKPRKD